MPNYANMSDEELKNLIEGKEPSPEQVSTAPAPTGNSVLAPAMAAAKE